VQKDLSRSLKLLAAEGARVIHGGELGEAIDKAMREAGGFLRLEDLKRNKAEWWDPVSNPTIAATRSWRRPCRTMPGTGCCGLAIMSRFDLADLGHNSPEYLHTFAEATKLAYAARFAVRE